MENKAKRLHDALLKNIEIGKRTSPLKAIRAHCLECLGYVVSEVADCSAGNDCCLFKFRFGKNLSGKRGSRHDKQPPKTFSLRENQGQGTI